jgi:histone deacetylase complex regulatory component SIN3
VLDEVSVLFADHADLLKEFTYFLPDAVQGVAKRQLDEAARVAEERARLRGRGVKIPLPKGGAGKLVAPPPPVQMVKDAEEEEKMPVQQQVNRVPAAHVKKVPFGATKGRSENEEVDICKGVVNGVVGFEPVRPPRR